MIYFYCRVYVIGKRLECDPNAAEATCSLQKQCLPICHASPNQYVYTERRKTRQAPCSVRTLPQPTSIYVIILSYNFR